MATVTSSARVCSKLTGVLLEVGVLKVKESCIPNTRVHRFYYGWQNSQRCAPVSTIVNLHHHQSQLLAQRSDIRAPRSFIHNSGPRPAFWSLNKRGIRIASEARNSADKPSESKDEVSKTETGDKNLTRDGEGEEEDDDEPLVARYDEAGKPLSNWMRMKMMMKAYGYVIIPVHWVIAPAWFGAFYYLIKMGVDIAPFLLKVGISEHHVNTLSNSGASNALMAYALYKIFTPLRYTVTIGATEMTIRYLRRKGYIKQAPRKEKTYRESLKETVQEVKEKMENR